MPTQNPTRKWLGHWFLLMMSSNGLAEQNNVNNMRRRDLQTNVFLRQRTTQSTKVMEEPCTAMIRDVMATVEWTDLQCETPTGMVYRIPHVDKAWIEEKRLGGELISGVTQIDLPPNTLIDMETQTLLLDSQPILRNPSSRRDLGAVLDNPNRLELTEEKARGTRTVLVVRVEASDTATTFSEAQLANDVFGDGGDPNNLVSQYRACSFNKFEPTKAWGRRGVTTNIQNGIVTLQLGLSKSAGETAFLNAINSELLSQFSTTSASNLADFIMLCLPPGVMDARDIAYAYMNGYKSVYNDIACGQVSTQIHEVGHNLNLNHSGKGSEEYGDKSCMMGYSYDEDDIPYMCFNAAKSWQLGWYSDKAVTVRPTAWNHEFTIDLAGIADYGTTDKNVLIKIEQETSPFGYFINYNLGKDMNRSTQLGKDQVLVTLKDTNNESNTSDLVATMRLEQTLRISNFNGNADEELEVKWQSTSNSVARIYIKLNAPFVPAPTNPPTTPPTKGPTLPPTTPPTKGPTAPPTKGPTAPPTKGPTPRPTTPPTKRPTPNPTRSPTPRPSPGPTKAPSISPSAAPSVMHSDTPTVSPSKDPTMEPSTLPSVSPSFVPSDVPSTVPILEPSLEPSKSSVPTFSTAPSDNPTLSHAPTTSSSPSFVPSDMPSLTPSLVPTIAASLEPSQGPSVGPSSTPSLSPSQAPSVVPSQGPSVMDSQGPTSNPSHSPSQGPTSSPTVAFSDGPTWSPTPRPSQSQVPNPTPLPAPLSTRRPTMFPTRETDSPTKDPRTPSPSIPPSSTSLQLETRMRLQVPGGIHSSTILKMCDEIEADLDSKLKLQHGSGTQTNVECRPDDPELSLSAANNRTENIFQHFFFGLAGPEENDDSDNGGNVGGPLAVNVVTTTFFPQRSKAPFQADFDSYVFNTVVADERQVLPSGYKMESDDSSYPPVLRLTVSSATGMNLGFIVPSFLAVLFLLVN